MVPVDTVEGVAHVQFNDRFSFGAVALDVFAGSVDCGFGSSLSANSKLDRAKTRSEEFGRVPAGYFRGDTAENVADRDWSDASVLLLKGK